MIAGRSLVARSGVKLASPFAVVVACMLFFAGHNQPGGGFAAGLMLGAVVALRAVVGLPVPVRSSPFLAAGGASGVVVAIAPMLLGNALLDQVTVETTVVVLGKIKFGTALAFDVGVALVVVGLVIALLDAFAAAELDAPPTEASPTDVTVEGNGVAT
jgi:multicomponent Na+:H+ antiporter subunit A